MNIDMYAVEHDPFLIAMRQELNDLEAARDAAHNLSVKEPSAVNSLKYDALVTLWARKKNKYEDALRSVLLP